MSYFVRRRLVTSIALIAFGAATAGLWIARPHPSEGRPLVVAEAKRGIADWSLRAQEIADELLDTSDATTFDHAFATPTGAPTAIACDDARTVVLQARTTLAGEPPSIETAKFAEATSDWVDPHGLWSVAPDAPAGGAIRRSAPRLLAELEAEPGAGPCVASREVGAELSAWSEELGRMFDQGLKEGAAKPAKNIEEAFAIAASTPFEDGAVTHGARDLAREIGREIGAMRAVYGAAIEDYAAAARLRVAPHLDADAWGRVVVAAALRAYVPQLDAHGAWAPLDEEISIYDLGLEADPPERLWTEMTRTAVGVRIERGAVAPLQNGDVVLRVGEVPLAGVSVEQSEQLSIVQAGAHASEPAKVTVLRARRDGPIELLVSTAREAPRSHAGNDAGHTSDLSVDLVRYGDGRAAVITITDVPDDLGPRLGAALDRAHTARDLRGVMLDLRANGGGSTDGAIAALGLFMPGVSLFPMRRRDGGIEVERSPEVPDGEHYRGPVAVLVDGDSASAAEMIAGALASYHRATVIGDVTYGKGCAQEYLDDDAHSGVLRLTTLLFALPDGSPVQKTGIFPHVRLSLPQVTEREASTARALEAWRGPDVRDLARVHEIPWPTNGGHVGVCRDAIVCRALRSLGTSPAAAR